MKNIVKTTSLTFLVLLTLPILLFATSTKNQLVPVLEAGHGNSCCIQQGPPGLPGTPGVPGAPGPAGPQGIPGMPVASAYAYFYTQTAQAGVVALGTINLTIIEPTQSGGFSLSAGGASVPVGGVYLLYYSILSSTTTASVGVRVNGGSVITNSVFSNNAVANTRITAQIILRLAAGDIVSLVNAQTVAILNTVIPAGANAAIPVPVELTLLKLAD